MQAAPQRAPPPLPLLECKAIGLLEDARVPALMQLLRALDPRPPVAVLEQEVLAAVPHTMSGKHLLLAL